jgi:hypothetical protein
VIGIVIVVWATGCTLAGETSVPESPARSAPDFLRQARSLEKGGRTEDALEACEEASFLAPEDEGIAREVRRLSAAAASRRIKAAREEIRAGRESPAFALLTESWRLSATSEAASLLKKLGYQQHAGAFRKREEIERWERRERELEAEAREKLNLGEREFRALRSDHFRLFTNMPAGRDWDRWLAPVLKVLDSLFVKYQTVFRSVIGRSEIGSALVVVFFRDGESYQQYLQANRIGMPFATAGFYNPARQASFFFRESGHGTVWPVLLHEITHQLNEQVLHAANWLPWINEGTAQYFEAGVVGPDFSVTIGRPLHENLTYLRVERVLEGDRYLPAEKIFNACAVADPSLGERPVRQIYAQMWGWAYFLLHNRESHRRILLECLKRERQNRESNEIVDPRQVYQETFAARGMPLAELDQAYKEFLRSVPLTEKRRGR